MASKKERPNEQLREKESNGVVSQPPLQEVDRHRAALVQRRRRATFGARSAMIGMW
jgi:hypothetical protein